MKLLPVLIPPRLRQVCAPFLAAGMLVGGGFTLPVRADSAPAAAAERDCYRLPDDTAELLRLDDEMLAFFAARVHRKNSIEKRLDEISAAILGEEGLHFRYESDGIYDVREAFRRRSGNCVTYAMLVVAVAREYRIPAEFNEVILRRRWSRAGELVLESRHLNVWVAAASGGYEIDLQLRDDLRASRFYARPVPDERAYSGLYSNEGIYRLAAGDHPGALRSLVRATEIDPGFPVAWANLGNANLIGGNESAARGCYERALALDSATWAAVSGLERIHTRAGRFAEAERFSRAARRFRERNPYYLLAIAREERASGDGSAARRHLARAIRIKSDEPEFYEEMVVVLRLLGREREARRWARRLEGLPLPVVAMQ